MNEEETMSELFLKNEITEMNLKISEIKEKEKQEELKIKETKN